MTNATQTHLNDLVETIEGDAVPMAVVDYIGFMGDNWKGGRKAYRKIDATAPDAIRYGVRDLRHVKSYGFKVVSLNKAARDKAAN